MVPFSCFIVCQLSLNTIGIYSLTFILYAKVFFATLTFQYLPLQWKISLKMYRYLLCYLFWPYYVPIVYTCHYNGKSVGKCIGTSYGTFSDPIVDQLSLDTTEIYSLTFVLYAKEFFFLPILSNTIKIENQFENA